MQIQRQSSFSSRPLLLLGGLALLVAAGVAAALWGGSGPAAKGRPAGGPPVTVSVPLVRQVTDWTRYTGQFAPVEMVDLRARVSGYLTEIHFTDGQMVNKGDLLFVIDPRPYETALATARAKLERAGASKEFAHRELGRAGELRQKDFVSQSILDQRVQDSRGAGAGVEAAQAAVRDAELNLQFTHIVAPISGRIGARRVTVGNLITGDGSSPTLLTTIVSQNPIYFGFDMSEADFLALQHRLGGKTDLVANPIPVEIQLDGETGFPHKGRLDFIDNQVDRGSGTIRARAVLDNADGRITPGLFGRVRLAASGPYQALLVPDSALVTDQSRHLVMTVAADGTVVPKAIETGPVEDGLRVVRSGLGRDDRVIITGLLRARPGAKVTPVPGAIEAGQP